MIITRPINIALHDWANQVIMDIPGSFNQLSGDNWQIWGEQFLLNTDLGAYGIPNPFSFDNWEDWAMRFCGVLS